MVLPLPDEKLWRWMLPAPKTNTKDRQDRRDPMDFDGLFNAQLNALKDEGNYRIFAELERQCGDFPKAKCHDDGRP